MRPKPMTTLPGERLAAYSNEKLEKATELLSYMTEIIAVSSVVAQLDHYLGAYSTAPMHRDNGSNLLDGDFYLDKTKGKMGYWDIDNVRWLYLDLSEE